MTELRMLRLAVQATRLNKVSNEHIRGSLGIRDIARKLGENRLRWLENVVRIYQE